MKTRELEAEVLRKGRNQDRFSLTADPADTGALRAALEEWLTAGKWSPAMWGQFELVVREPGKWKTLAKVRGK